MTALDWPLYSNFKWAVRLSDAKSGIWQAEGGLERDGRVWRVRRGKRDRKEVGGGGGGDKSQVNEKNKEEQQGRTVTC